MTSQDPAHNVTSVPILTYHGCNVNGHDYAVNDHVALATDLALLRELGYRVVSLRAIAEWVIGIRTELPFPCVGLSFDDGPWFDWIDLEHPTWGATPSFRRLLCDAAQSGMEVHATSFVIASPQARAELDRTCMIGCGWWTDDWWADAERSGVIAIESHSWDHNHDTLASAPLPGKPAGRFDVIDTLQEADAEIRQAADYLDQFRATPRDSLLAYPYGQTSRYLTGHYLPGHVDRHRTLAAFTTVAEPVTRRSDRWQLPRFVCGWHWKSVEQLKTEILGR
jgi:hypothetical protein